MNKKHKEVPEGPRLSCYQWSKSFKVITMVYKYRFQEIQVIISNITLFVTISMIPQSDFKVVYDELP